MYWKCSSGIKPHTLQQACIERGSQLKNDVNLWIFNSCNTFTDHKYIWGELTPVSFNMTSWCQSLLLLLFWYSTEYACIYVSCYVYIHIYTYITYIYKIYIYIYFYISIFTPVVLGSVEDVLEKPCCERTLKSTSTSSLALKFLCDNNPGSLQGDLMLFCLI